ncbi:hypothetical protein HK57_00321 [Aspergillus ustus]|uniref:BD-FAE-like domain-containing protein n=1 Tax=Aspergillus ustus TaxID=40382 RepID=A0A0C1EGU4_ASPUT|nr:hypothetical protein HK57_00321 [Aspergillus ustus]
MGSDTNATTSTSSAGAGAIGSTTPDPIAVAARGREITGLDIFRRTADESAICMTRVEELMSTMHADVPPGGTDISYGSNDSRVLRFWKPSSKPSSGSTNKAPPIILFVHGGSWRIGTYLDSIGSAKVPHLTSLGYAFATVNYTLFPAVSVAEQVQEVANAVGHLVKNSTTLEIDPERVILMGHSSGAHVASLLGTDTRYLERAGVAIAAIHGVIALDGSNYNAPAELLDSPGPVAENMLYALGKEVETLREMSPTYNARGPNARAFLLLHAQRQGDIRQAAEFVNVLGVTGTTEAALHVFEGEGFEGHVQLLLRLGDQTYPATKVLVDWLSVHVPVA